MQLFDVYSIYDIEPVKGEGAVVYTSDNTPYLDFYGGHAVISIGHAHPRYVDAISRQVSRLGFYSNSVKNSLQVELAQRLGKLSGYDDYALFLCNSGAEANENAFKLASFHTGRSRLLALRHAFHGRTSGAVAATDNPAIVAPFNRTDNVEFVDMEDTARVNELLESGDFCAVIIEGIQGVGGIIQPSDHFLKSVEETAKRTGTLLIADEIQSGCGRSGNYFAHSKSGIRPDIVTMAKGIGNGFPIGAVAISPEIQPRKGMLGTTFGGNHLACAAAIAVADVMEDEALMDNAAKTGTALLEGLKSIDGITDIRGRGLMIGIDTDRDGAALRRRLLFDHHIFTGAAGKKTIRLLPPLCITAEQTEIFLSALKTAIDETPKA